MRLGLVRLQSRTGVGDTNLYVGTPPDVVANINGELQTALNSVEFNMEHGTAYTPDFFRNALQTMVNGFCTQWGQCGDFSSNINDAVAQYTVAYQNAYNMVTSGKIYLPPSYISPEPLVPLDPNALNNVAPTPTYIAPAPPSVNVMNPPQPMPPVSSTNAGSFTGGTNVNTPAVTGGQAAASFFDQTVSIMGHDVPTWALIGGGVVLALLLGRK